MIGRRTNNDNDRHASRKTDVHRKSATNADVWRVSNVSWTCSALYLIGCVLQTVSGDCSGGVTVLTANSTYQEFISPNYPYGYPNNQDCTWRLAAANSSYAVRVNILDVSIEFHADCVYDTGQAYDGYNISSTSLGLFCGTSLIHYISTGQYMTVTFHSDYSLAGKGFRAQYYSGEYSSLQDPVDDSSSLNLNAIIAGGVGGVVLLAIIISVVFTYIQAKKAKAIRNGRVRTTNVIPYDQHGEYIGPPAPPAYGELYASPMSPPPAYCEYDPNPNPSGPLPARSEFINPEAGEGLVSVTPSYASGGTDAIINTRFIRPLNVRNSSSQTPPSDQLITPSPYTIRTPQTLGPNTGVPPTQALTRGATNVGVTSTMQVLSPRSLQSQPREQPVETGSLPNAVMSDESQMSNVGRPINSRPPTVTALQASALPNAQGNTVAQTTLGSVTAGQGPSNAGGSNIIPATSVA